MEELEARAAHNRGLQKQFILDALSESAALVLYVSTLDGSPFDSPEGLAWGLMPVKPGRVFVHPATPHIVLLDQNVLTSLDYVFAMTRGEPARSLVVLDTPAQLSAAADMFNTPTVREMVGQPNLPLQALHPNHTQAAPAQRRAAFRVLKGGAS